MDHGVIGEILGPVERDGAFQERRAAHGKQDLPEQPLGAETRPIAVAVADFQIRVRLPECLSVDGGGEPEGYVRVLFEEARQPRHQPDISERGADADRDRPAALAAEQVLGAGGQVVEGLADDRQVAVAGVGQAQRARQPGEERGPQPLLELLDLLADRGRGDVQFLRRFGEAGVTGGGLEGAQPVQRRQSTAHGEALFSPSLRGQLTCSLWPGLATTIKSHQESSRALTRCLSRGRRRAWRRPGAGAGATWREPPHKARWRGTQKRKTSRIPPPEAAPDGW